MPVLTDEDLLFEDRRRTSDAVALEARKTADTQPGESELPMACRMMRLPPSALSFPRPPTLRLASSCLNGRSWPNSYSLSGTTVPGDPPKDESGPRLST
jgi:hypothetical protein